MRLYDVLIRPVLTERTYAQRELFSKHTFEVALNANKTEIAQAFQAVFKIKPLAVNVVVGKPQRVRTGTKRPGVAGAVKKAVITLPKGTVLNIYGDEAAEETKDEGTEKKAAPEVKEDKAEKPAKTKPVEGKTKEIKPAPAKTKEVKAESTQPVKPATKRVETKTKKADTTKETE